MNIFEQPHVKKQLEKNEEFVKDTISKNEKNHIEKINELHIKSQTQYTGLMDSSIDIENPDVSKKAFDGDIEGIDNIQKKRDEILDNVSSIQEKIIQEMDKKENTDKNIELLKNNPPSMN